MQAGGGLSAAFKNFAHQGSDPALLPMTNTQVGRNTDPNPRVLSPSLFLSLLRYRDRGPLYLKLADTWSSDWFKYLLLNSRENYYGSLDFHPKMSHFMAELCAELCCRSALADE